MHGFGDDDQLGLHSEDFFRDINASDYDLSPYLAVAPTSADYGDGVKDFSPSIQIPNYGFDGDDLLLSFSPSPNLFDDSTFSSDISTTATITTSNKNKHNNIKNDKNENKNNKDDNMFSTTPCCQCRNHIMITPAIIEEAEFPHQEPFPFCDNKSKYRNIFSLWYPYSFA